MKDVKTNVMRILDKVKADYCVRTYEAEVDGEYIPLSAQNSMEKIGVENERCFKTIVTRARPSVYYVFMLPIAEELDLKKCAKAVNEKAVEPIAVKELLPLTGYIRGGCSPIGMKKQFSTVIDETCILFDSVVFSAGKRGVMVDVKVDDLFALIPIKSAEITR
jgi:Cys-tRNA(Pro)/Cys-tRNA(Cys) deacylase